MVARGAEASDTEIEAIIDYLAKNAGRREGYRQQEGPVGVWRFTLK
jgi:hypothetical protein